MRTLIIAMAFMVTLPVACAAEEDTQEREGLFSKGSFLSDAINSVTNKIGNIGPDGERIVSNDARGIPKDTLEYDADPFGRPLPKPSYRKKGEQGTGKFE